LPAAQARQLQEAAHAANALLATAFTRRKFGDVGLTGYIASRRVVGFGAPSSPDFFLSVYSVKELEPRTLNSIQGTNPDDRAAMRCEVSG